MIKPVLLIGATKLKITVDKVVPLGLTANSLPETLFNTCSKVVIWVVVATIMVNI